MEKKRICYLVSSLCNEGPVNVMYNIVKNIDFFKKKKERYEKEYIVCIAYRIIIFLL